MRGKAIGAMGGVMGVAAGYSAAVALLRPWWVRWGASDAEVRGVLPADDYYPGMLPSSTRAITIDAPVEVVWPWLVQIGQDRAGFYSYDWLERIFGDHIHNAETIHPEWQELEPGDLVRSIQDEPYHSDWAELGWRVLAVEPEHFIALEGWGQMVIEPLGDDRTRMYIRTHGRFASRWLRMFWALFGDPAHFIMERGMLLGIKRRAEQQQEERQGWPATGPDVLRPALAV